jgi:hypothetical protein
MQISANMSKAEAKNKNKNKNKKFLLGNKKFKQI